MYTGKNEYDVIIVGAGPAGASAAKVLKDANINVLIAEKETLPRYKCCSGILFPRGLKYVNKYFGNLPKEILCKKTHLKGLKFYLSKDRCIGMPLELFLEGEEDKSHPLELLLTTGRKDLDYWLAKNSKVEIIDELKFTSFQKKENQVITTFEKKGEKIDIRSRYLIGADGGNSHVRDVLYPDLRKKVPWMVAYEEHYEGEIDLDPQCFYGFTDKSFSGFYVGMYIKDGIIEFGTGGMQGVKVKPYADAFVKYLEENHGFKPKEKVFTGGCLMAGLAMIKTFCFGEGNVLLTGEAAGFLNLIGEGISSAVTTGRIAGEAVTRSMNSGKPAIEEYLPVVDHEKSITLKSMELGKNFGF